MFDKLKELFNKNKSSDSDDELLDFSEYADIQGGDDSTEVDEGTAQRTLEAIRSSESMANSDKTVVPDLKTEIRQSSIQKKKPSPANDATEIVGRNSSENFISGLKDKFGELLNRSKSSDELEIESFDEENDGKKRTIVRLTLIALIAILIVTIIDDFSVEEVQQPVQKTKPFVPPKQEKPLEKIKNDPVIESDNSAMEDSEDNNGAQALESEEEPSTEVENEEEVDLETEPEPENMDNAEKDLFEDNGNDSKETSESEELEETESQSDVPSVEAQPEVQEASTQDVMSEPEEIPAPPTTTVPVEEPVIEDTTVEEVEEGIGLSKEELVEIENQLSKENGADDISNLSDLNVNYLATGSGLVYNCVGKHWACISKINFVKCNKLSVMNPKRCFAVKHYGDKRSCQVQQIKNIDSNKSTHFCY